MKTFIMLMALTLASGIAMAGGGKNRLEEKVLYDDSGRVAATVITLPQDCVPAPAHAGDEEQSIIVLNEGDCDLNGIE